MEESTHRYTIFRGKDKEYMQRMRIYKNENLI
jgi:hypothetical protein